jgi:hypothetical protein
MKGKDRNGQADATETRAYREAFHRLVCAERTKQPGLTRRQAVRNVAAREPSLWRRIMGAPQTISESLQQNRELSCSPT